MRGSINTSQSNCRAPFYLPICCSLIRTFTNVIACLSFILNTNKQIRHFIRQKLSRKQDPQISYFVPNSLTNSLTSSNILAKVIVDLKIYIFAQIFNCSRFFFFLKINVLNKLRPKGQCYSKNDPQIQTFDQK